MLQALVARGPRQQVRASNRPATAGDSPLDKVTWLLDQVAQVATSYNEVARAVGYSANSGAVTRRVGLLAGVLWGITRIETHRAGAKNTFSLFGSTTYANQLHQIA